MKSSSESSFFREKLSIKSLIIPIILMIIGLFLIFGTDAFFEKKNAENTDKMETRLVAMINDLDGVSDSEVMLLTDDDGNVKGAAVICNGGDLSQNQKNIIELITSLFGVGASDVFVGGR